MKLLEIVNPFLLNELIVAGKLPSDHLFGIFGCKIELLQSHCLSDVFSFHHMPSFELNGKIFGAALKPIYFFNVQQFDGTFGQFVIRFEELGII